MVDEAHERSVYTDLLLAILKKICQRRPALRLIVSSATLDATAMQDYFASNAGPDAATIISLEGRTYPVQVAYLQEPTPNYVEIIPSLIEDIHQGPGDILVFLTGREEIDQCLEELLDLLPKLSKSRYQLVPLPLHAGLSMVEQMKIFEPAAPGTRKAIIATNIAETSVTIDGIKFVIDCGHVKIRTFDSSSAISLLSIVPISQASAIQRAGRAGRTSRGICYRLYPESAFKVLSQLSVPEVVHTDLTLPILHLKALGIDNLMKLEWLTIPPSANIAYALDVLTECKIIDSDGHLTQMGRKVAELPTDIKVASMLFNSEDYKCGEEILTIAAMVAVQNVFITPGHNETLIELEHRKFTAEEGVCSFHISSAELTTNFLTRTI
ncbi:hypothetical protein EWM64_g2392 [Hericium alpestre]|uniref:Helicase C-terminal domain-containing protein n=1 Tax=Hericium alpestre TaxID=135208 RepID=A0A4Z0A5N2_9AGAM|nr:hypothetical protein EWM64_g2392 [Hericium alpestre]